MIKLKIWKSNENAEIPKFETCLSACFDIKACLKGEESVKAYTFYNTSIRIPVIENNTVTINPFDRVLVPTGLVFDIPVGYSVRLHSRSGLSLKNGVALANSEGVIDADYTDPSFAMIINVSGNPYVINHGDRIIQGELVQLSDYALEETDEMPVQKTDRVGGFGSTGV